MPMEDFNADLGPAKRMRLVHRRKERVLTRSTVPLLSQLTYRLSRCCYCSEEKDKGQKKETEEYAKVKREKRAIRGYSGKGLLVASGLAYEY